MFRSLLYNLKNKRILETDYPRGKAIAELFRIIKIKSNVLLSSSLQTIYS